MKKYFIEESRWFFKYCKYIPDSASGYVDFYQVDEEEKICLDVDMSEFLTTPYDTVDDAKSVVNELVSKNMFDYETFADRSFDDYDVIYDYDIVSCEIEPGIEVDSDYISENHEYIDDCESYMAVPDEMKKLIWYGDI